MSVTALINQDLCLNFNYKKMKCQKCRQRCPKNCIDADGSISENCIQCGLCLAVCPTEAVAVKGFITQELLALTTTAGNATIGLVCKVQNGQSPWPCLGFLEPALLTALAIPSRQVVIQTSGCRECQADVSSHLTHIIKQANNLLQQYSLPLIQQGRVVLPQPDKSISRRAFFGQLFGAAVETVREVARPSESKPERLEKQPWVRKAWSGMPDSLLTAIAGEGFFTMKISDSCQACGMCAKFCSAKAISINDKMDEMDIFHESLNCIGCEVCVAHCPIQAITICPSAPLSGRRKVITARLPRCQSCNALYQPVNNSPVCLECMLKNRKPLI